MLRIVVEPADGEKSEVPVKDIMTLGRRKQCDVVITDSAVSRHHATIELVDGAYVLRDEGSSNGTMLNGERISEQKLRDGDKITIGETVMTFKMEEPAPAPAPARAPVPERAPQRRSATAAINKSPSRKKSGRRRREDADVDAAKAETLEREGVIKLIAIGVCGVCFLIVMALLVKVAFPSRGGGGQQRTRHENPESRIHSLFGSGMKLMGKSEYAEARASFVKCSDLCASLRSKPKFSGDGYYWLEQKQQDCNVKIRECGEKLFQEEMRELRGRN